MVNNQKVNIIIPVKDAVEMAEQAIRSIVDSGRKLTVYDDYSTPETVERLDTLKQELGIEVVHIREHFDHPSPNYRWVLIDAQRWCLEAGEHLVIVESDVLVRPDTIDSLLVNATEGTGLIAAVTCDEDGKINFPYEYARRIAKDGVCTKRLSFCCTLLTKAFLQAYDFALLDPKKDWYDVHISRVSRQMGFENKLIVSHPVLHQPHSSRPWKRLKYTNPLLYYWRKLTQRRDKI